MQIKEFIEKSGLKIGFVCDKVGISRNTMHRIFIGEAVSPEVANRIKKVYGDHVIVSVSRSGSSHVRNHKKVKKKTPKGQKMQIKEFIEKSGLKIGFVCDKVGISRNTMYRIFIGEAVSPEVADRIKKVCGDHVIVSVSRSGSSHVRKRKKVKTEYMFV